MTFEFLSALGDWLVLTIGSMGYFGIFLFTLIESTVLPLPSELVMIPAGILVAKGQMDPLMVLVMGCVGSIAGSLINYYVALHFGRRVVNHVLDTYGRFIFITHDHIVRSEQFFAKHGEFATFMGRLLPIIRHLISLPAGFSRMSLGKFSFYTGLGSTIWLAILLFVGYFVGSNEGMLKHYIDTITYFLLSFCCGVTAVYLYFHMNFSSEKR